MVALATGPSVQVSAPPRDSFHRFTLSDLTQHQWLLRRLLQSFPHHTDRSLGTWLRNMMNDNSVLFLASDNAVALFETVKLSTLALKPVVIERFVFVKEGYGSEGLEFYKEAAKWAKGQSAEQLLVEELTDVPHEAIKDVLGRLFTRQQIFARV